MAPDDPWQTAISIIANSDRQHPRLADRRRRHAHSEREVPGRALSAAGWPARLHARPELDRQRRRRRAPGGRPPGGPAVAWSCSRTTTTSSPSPRRRTSAWAEAGPTTSTISAADGRSRGRATASATTGTTIQQAIANVTTPRDHDGGRRRRRHRSQRAVRMRSSRGDSATLDTLPAARFHASLRRLARRASPSSASSSAGAPCSSTAPTIPPP